MLYIRHYFPGVNLEEITDEDFAILSEEALWLHQQLTLVNSAKAIFNP